MKLHYHLTSAQIQDTVALLKADQEGVRITPDLLCFADIKIHGETVCGTHLGLPNISLLGLLREIRDFLQEDRVIKDIQGWGDCQYAIRLSMPRSTSLLALGPPPGIKIKPPSSKAMSQIMRTFIKGYMRHVPQLAAYSGLWAIEEEFDFKIARTKQTQW